MSDCPPTSYKDLVRRTSRVLPAPTSVEAELDALVLAYEDRKRQAAEDKAAEEADAARPDPIVLLREQITTELIPVINDLSAKYAGKGIGISFDPSNLLAGGRELDIELRIEGNRTELHGIVTKDAISFHEVRHSKDFRGELTSGPALRLRHLNAHTFQSFVCERLMLLIRMAMQRR